jgi:hypothetical protein
MVSRESAMAVGTGCPSGGWRFDLHVLFLRGGHHEPAGDREFMW